MVYENPLEKLGKTGNELTSHIFSNPNLSYETRRLLFEEATYYEACAFLKKNKVPNKFPEIRQAEKLYNKGMIHEANNILYDFWNELEKLSSINKKDIKYYGN